MSKTTGNVVLFEGLHLQSGTLPCHCLPPQGSHSLQAPRLLLPSFAKLLLGQRLRKSGEGQDVPMGLPEAI